MDYTDNFRIEWSSPERYEIVDRVGGGKYSEVRIFCRRVARIFQSTTGALIGVRRIGYRKLRNLYHQSTQACSRQENQP
jgi:hypothetical protein